MGAAGKDKGGERVTLVCLFALDVCLAGVAHCSGAEPAGRQQGRKGRKKELKWDREIRD